MQPEELTEQRSIRELYLLKCQHPVLTGLWQRIRVDHSYEKRVRTGRSLLRSGLRTDQDQSTNTYRDRPACSRVLGPRGIGQAALPSSVPREGRLPCRSVTRE